MAYTVKEIFFTLQGEGANTGCPAVFLRFTGCNLWSGREEDRSDAVCRFCDTDFVGGTRFTTAADLADAVAACWGDGDEATRFVVLTGGEPALQYDASLRDALKARGFRIAMETNGTVAVRSGDGTGVGGIDWLTVSPKAGTTLAQTTADELKLIFPQAGLAPDEACRLVAAPHRFIQPMDGADYRANLAAAMAFLHRDRRWRLSLQTHKLAGFP